MTAIRGKGLRYMMVARRDSLVLFLLLNQDLVSEHGYEGSHY